MSDPIKAVIFDWAGTVIDFGCVAPIEALQTAFADQGVPVSASDARRDMGRAKLDHVWQLLNHPPVRADWIAARSEAPTLADRDRIYQALVPLMKSAAIRHATLIPGAAALVSDLRARGVKIGSNTGYTREMMEGILPRAAAQGYAPDALVCAGETPSGRPAPLMTWKVMVELDVWPASACVKVDDAEVGIEEGRQAGCWTVGLAGSGNGVGLGLEAYEALAPEDRQARLQRSAAALTRAGADYVVNTIAELGPVLDLIAVRIAAGEKRVV